MFTGAAGTADALGCQVVSAAAAPTSGVKPDAYSTASALNVPGGKGMSFKESAAKFDTHNSKQPCS